jgi:hypothetical protein
VEKRKTLPLLVGRQTSTAIVENIMCVTQKLQIEEKLQIVSYELAISLLDIYSKELKSF